MPKDSSLLQRMHFFFQSCVRRHRGYIQKPIERVNYLVTLRSFGLHQCNANINLVLSKCNDYRYNDTQPGMHDTSKLETVFELLQLSKVQYLIPLYFTTRCLIVEEFSFPSMCSFGGLRDCILSVAIFSYDTIICICVLLKKDII